MRTLTARPALRWVLPLALLLVLLASGLLVSRASADPKLAPRSAEQLLVDLQGVKVDGLSGTVVQDANLGIPALPGGSSGESAKFTDLISGSHTMRVWYSGPDKTRLALQGTYTESDVITNGTDVWTYSSADKTATHRTYAADAKRPADAQAPEGAPKTPQEAAQAALKAVDKTTEVSTDSYVQVAGRDAYELVLTPKDAGSLIKQVRIAVDAETKLPLRVRVLGADPKPVLDVAYTDISFTRPDDAQFAFNPPEGTKVTEVAAADHGDQNGKDGKKLTAAEKKELAAKRAQAEKDTQTYGSGWTTVVVTKVGTSTGDNAQLTSFLAQLPQVSGTWGSGRQLAGTAFTAILTDDGRLAVGAVSPELVQQALAK